MKHILAAAIVLAATPAVAQQAIDIGGKNYGAVSGSLAAVTDYSYRGISQTQRQPGVQPGITYTTPNISDDVLLRGYASAWGSNVSFPGTGASIEIDTTVGLQYKLNHFSVDASFIRSNYPGAAPLEFNEWGLLARYNFGVAAVTGGLHYSPNFFGNSGEAWYKQVLVTVPMPFVKVDNVKFSAFGSVGNQYVQNYAAYGIPNNNYWDYQVGLKASTHGFDLAVSYVSTNVDAVTCGLSQNCTSRAIVTLTKNF